MRPLLRLGNVVRQGQCIPGGCIESLKYPSLVTILTSDTYYDEIVELQAMAEDAKRRQCRLGERPLKDGKEARALKILLDTVDQCQSSHRSALKVIIVFKACVCLELRV